MRGGQSHNDCSFVLLTSHKARQLRHLQCITAGQLCRRNVPGGSWQGLGQACTSFEGALIRKKAMPSRCQAPESCQVDGNGCADLSQARKLGVNAWATCETGNSWQLQLRAQGVGTAAHAASTHSKRPGPPTGVSGAAHLGCVNHWRVGQGVLPCRRCLRRCHNRMEPAAAR